MRENRRLLDSFQGCVVAAAPYVISTLTSIAAWHYMNSLSFPPFVVWTVAIIGGMVVFQIFYIVKTRIGE